MPDVLTGKKKTQINPKADLPNIRKFCMIFVNEKHRRLCKNVADLMCNLRLLRFEKERLSSD